MHNIHGSLCKNGKQNEKGEKRKKTENKNMQACTPVSKTARGRGSSCQLLPRAFSSQCPAPTCCSHPIRFHAIKTMVRGSRHWLLKHLWSQPKTADVSFLPYPVAVARCLLQSDDGHNVQRRLLKVPSSPSKQANQYVAAVQQ